MLVHPPAVTPGAVAATEVTVGSTRPGEMSDRPRRREVKNPPAVEAAALAACETAMGGVMLVVAKLAVESGRRNELNPAEIGGSWVIEVVWAGGLGKIEIDGG